MTKKEIKIVNRGIRKSTKSVIFDILNMALESTDLSQTDYVSYVEDRMCKYYKDYKRYRITEHKTIVNPKRKITIVKRYQNWLIDVLPTQKDEMVVAKLGSMIKKCDTIIGDAIKYMQKKKPLKSLDNSKEYHTFTI